MAWYSVFLKTAFITPNFHVRLNVRSYLLRFPIQAAINELHIQYLVTLCDLVVFVEKNLKRNRVQWEFQIFQTEQILSLKFVSHLEVISGAFCF